MRCAVIEIWIAAVSFVCVPALADESLVRLLGADFEGGAQTRFGSTFYGQNQVNYVYAEPTGPLSVMIASFELESVPHERACLCLRGRDHEGPDRCDIEITLNAVTLLNGPGPFAKNRWDIHCIELPDNALRKGSNTLTIANREKRGEPGLPPWFMLAESWIDPKPPCAAAGSSLEADFFVTLPDPGKQNGTGSWPNTPDPQGFKIRGIKGWRWTPEQYLEEIPFLARFRMNFLMNCYLSMFSFEQKPWNSGQSNLWWEPLPEKKKRAYEKVVRSCREHGIEFCFAMNPNLLSSRPLAYDRETDIDALWQHYEWMVGLGVKWFSICLDDISKGIDAEGQSKVVNEMFRRLRARNSEAQMILCPTYYWGDGTDKSQRPYLDTIASLLNSEVYLFWTGDHVVGRITRAAAESYKHMAGHRLILWDNYPVNDDSPTMHLGPVVGRDSDLCDVIEGYMSNPMCQQNQINRIPLFTCAEYAYSPRTYDPARSIARSIMLAGANDEQQTVLERMVEAYPGMLLHKAGTSFNPVRMQFDRLAAEPHSRYVAESYVHYMSDLAARMERAFPCNYLPARKTLNDDIVWMKQRLTDQYGP